METVEVEQSGNQDERNEGRDCNDNNTYIGPSTLCSGEEQKSNACPVSSTKKSCRERLLNSPGEVQISMIGKDIQLDTSYCRQQSCKYKGNACKRDNRSNLDVRFHLVSPEDSSK